jgi:hypothetical protein
MRTSISKNRLRLPRLEIAGTCEHVLAVPDERLRMEHGGVLPDLDPCIEQACVMELLGGSAGPVVRVRGHEEADARSPSRGTLDLPDHPAVGHVRVHDVESLSRAVEELRDRVGDRPVAAGRVVQDGRRHVTGLERGEEDVHVVSRQRAAEPTEARDEDELQLRDDRARDADEQVVEAAVLEVILDAGPTDPADAAVDDECLAVVDVAQTVQVPADGAGGAERPERRAHLRRTGRHHLDAGREEPIVEVRRAPLRIGAIPVDDEPDGDALGRLGGECAREAVADLARAEAELVDVDRGRRALDVREEPRVERGTADEHLSGPGRRLRERQGEIAALDPWASDELTCAVGDGAIGNVHCEVGLQVRWRHTSLPRRVPAARRASCTRAMRAST